MLCTVEWRTENRRIRSVKRFEGVGEPRMTLSVNDRLCRWHFLVSNVCADSAQNSGSCI